MQLTITRDEGCGESAGEPGAVWFERRGLPTPVGIEDEHRGTRGARKKEKTGRGRTPSCSGRKQTTPELQRGVARGVEPGQRPRERSQTSRQETNPPLHRKRAFLEERIARRR